MGWQVPISPEAGALWEGQPAASAHCMIQSSMDMGHKADLLLGWEA